MVHTIARVKLDLNLQSLRILPVLPVSVSLCLSLSSLSVSHSLYLHICVSDFVRLCSCLSLQTKSALNDYHLFGYLVVQLLQSLPLSAAIIPQAGPYVSPAVSP